MPFPEFDLGKRKVLFFSRGRGRGHAIPDLEIAREIERIRDDVQFRFVSYATGARTIEEFGYPLIDLGLPDMNGTAETTVLAGKLIGGLRPDVVVAHEEFAALPAAKIFSKPTVMLTDWFTDPEKFSMQSLRFADRVLFLDASGHFEEPDSARGRVEYIGAVVRRFVYSRKDRNRARRELALAPDGTVITIFPGSWTERMAPIFDLVIAAFESLHSPAKRLVWLAGEDQKLISRRVRGRDDVIVLEQDWTIDRLMAASDLAITKGSRNTLVELAALGIRSLSISHGLNAMDDRRSSALAVSSLTPRKLARAITVKLSEAPPRPKKFNGAREAARVIAAVLDGS